ncbi:uncharacterized protein [Argopecten irradians]|uniref:uncharacterized protein isoform X2 n=1 Tax=Argopecten irradians TaxID=31199 RepID=UPI0037197CA7
MPPMNIQKYDWITSKRDRYPILWSAYSGDLTGLQRQVANVMDITEVKDDNTNTSILGWAVVGNQLAIVKYLTDRYPELLAITNKYEATPLFLCSVSGNVDMFKFLVRKGLSPHRRIKFLDSVLMLTAARGNLELTRYLVNTYPELLRKTSKHGMNPFLYSCYSGSIEMFECMLQLNFDPKVSDNDGINCLMIAAYCGHLPLVQYILDHASDFDIDINTRNVDGMNAIIYSMMSDNPEVTDTLYRNGVTKPSFSRMLLSFPLRLIKRLWHRDSIDKASHDLTMDEYLDLFSGIKEKYRHIRVVFVGPENVGKTTLCLRLQKKEVDISVRRPTRGADLFLQLYEIGWESKRWTPLVINRPEVVIHKRLGGMLRDKVGISSDSEGNGNVESEVFHPTNEPNTETIDSETVGPTPQVQPTVDDTEASTPLRGNVKQVNTLPIFSRRMIVMMTVVAFLAIAMLSTDVETLFSTFYSTTYAKFMVESSVHVFNIMKEYISIHLVQYMYDLALMALTFRTNKPLFYLAFVVLSMYYGGILTLINSWILYVRVTLVIVLLAVVVKRRWWLRYGKRKGKISEIACEDESEEVYQQSNKQKENLAFLSMWDMGGDLAFQATNVVFISAHGVYILTFRAIDYFTDNLQLVRLKNWVRNIGAYSSRVYNPSKLRPHHPPIIIVGTHMDQVNIRFKDETPSEREDRLKSMRQDICSIAELANSNEEGFVFLRFCTVDNSIDDDPAFEKLRNYIVEAAVYQDQWERELPASWLALEREILKQREWKHVLTLKEIKDLDNKCESPIGDEENIKMFLEYLHSTRSVLYFRQYDKVITNPQWVINAFREILTDEKFLDPDNLLLEADRRKYLQHALLTVNLAKMLWDLKEEGSYIQHIDILLAFLEEFGLLVKACVGQTEQGNPVYDENYTVPSKLQSIEDVKQISDLLKVKGTVCSRTLCFVFKEVFTPQELFERIYAGVIKAFRPIDKDSAIIPNQGPTKQIYKGLGCFMIDDLCNMVVHTQWEHSVITVTLFTTSEPRIPEGTGKRVREALEVIIRHTLEVSRQDHLQYLHKLHCKLSLDQSDSPREEDGIVRAAKGVSCHGADCSGKHTLTKLDWQVWFPVSEKIVNC